jgi:hypothetical protein
MPRHRFATMTMKAPDGFPVDAYNAIYNGIPKKARRRKRLWADFRDAWSAVAYRFLSLDYYADAFAKSVEKDGIAPAQPMRGKQERFAFGCILNALSCLETAHYGLFAVGALVSKEFPLCNEKDRGRVTMDRTARKFAQVFPREPVTIALRRVERARAVKRLQTVRNIIAHRANPPRSFRMSEPKRADWKLTKGTMKLGATRSLQSERTWRTCWKSCWTPPRSSWTSTFRLDGEG